MDASGKPGYIASSAAHAALLVLALLSFSRTPKFEDAQETVPIDLVSTQDFNQIMHGDKSAKQVQPKQRADKIADIIEAKPQPPIAEAKRDVPTPPPPLKRISDPGEADKIQPPKPPALTATAPPPPKATKPAPVPPVTDKSEDAEAIKPSPKVQPKDESKKDETKEPELKFDQIAKLLEQDKRKPELKPPDTPASKPKSGDDSKDPPRKFSADEIERLLSKEAPQRKAATNKELQQLASLGSPTANAEKMSPSLEAEMNGWFRDRFEGCWVLPITLPQESEYMPEIRVALNIDGSLALDPTLQNPPGDPAWQPLAESAIRAVHTCDPLPVPDKFKPYFEEWRDRTVRFDPHEKDM
jgi:colicin import membrane protein